ncbi:MAG TPA: type II and III secretion system protein family protein, partial [Candidatus Hypogeohydataceae bacterium YC41]
MLRVAVLCVIMLLSCAYCLADPPQWQKRLSAGVEELAVLSEEEQVGGEETTSEQVPLVSPAPAPSLEERKEKAVGEQAPPVLPPPTPSLLERPAEEEAIKVGISLGRIYVTMGQSRLVTTREEVQRVSVTTPDVAGVQAVSLKEVLVDGKKPGVTTMIIWDKKGKTYIYDLTVQRDVALLKERLQEIDEGIKIEVHPAQDSVILYGEVDSPAKITKAIAVAAAFFEDSELYVLAGPGGTIVAEGYRPKPLKFAPQGGGTFQGAKTLSFEEVTRVWNAGEGAIITTKNGKVISFLRLKNPLQVELQVRFAQVDLRLLKELGFDNAFTAFRNQNTTSGFVTGTTGVLPLDTAPNATSPSGAIRYFLIHQDKNFLFQTQLRALEDRQVIKLLSEPNLTVISGQEATFLVGGEFPVLVPQQTVSTTFPLFTIQWKVFGTKLELVPEVKENGMINLKLIPEVSERSDELGVDFPTGGQLVRIPGLETRRAETTVEMEDGESLVMAGLVQDKERNVRTQVPLLGDIPGLGIFFRKKFRRKERTELMIVITPRLVKPMSKEEAKELLESQALKRKTVYEEFLEKGFGAMKSLTG